MNPTTRIKITLVSLAALIALIAGVSQANINDPGVADLLWKADCATQLLYSTAGIQLESTYREAAAVVIPLALETLKTKLQVFAEKDYSRTEAKALRKYILELRLYYEVLAYGYPAFSQNDDPWMEGWIALKKGYSFLGKYKALKKSQTEALEKKKVQVANWTGSFILEVDDIVHRLNNQNVENASKSSVRVFPFRGLHWDTSQLPDEVDSSARTVVKGLIVNLIKKAGSEITQVYETKDFADEYKSEAFHDFRKQLRVVVKLADAFPDLYEKTETYKQIVDMVWYLGQHNDLVEPLLEMVGKQKAHVVAEGEKKSKFAKQKKHVKKSWKNYKNRFPKKVAKGLLKSFLHEIDPSL